MASTTRSGSSTCTKCPAFAAVSNVPPLGSPVLETRGTEWVEGGGERLRIKRQRALRRGSHRPRENHTRAHPRTNRRGARRDIGIRRLDDDQRLGANRSRGRQTLLLHLQEHIPAGGVGINRFEQCHHVASTRRGVGGIETDDRRHVARMRGRELAGQPAAPRMADDHHGLTPRCASSRRNRAEVRSGVGGCPSHSDCPVAERSEATPVAIRTITAQQGRHGQRIAVPLDSARGDPERVEG